MAKNWVLDTESHEWVRINPADRTRVHQDALLAYQKANHGEIRGKKIDDLLALYLLSLEGDKKASEVAKAEKLPAVTRTVGVNGASPGAPHDKPNAWRCRKRNDSRTEKDYGIYWDEPGKERSIIGTPSLSALEAWRICKLFNELANVDTPDDAVPFRAEEGLLLHPETVKNLKARITKALSGSDTTEWGAALTEVEGLIGGYLNESGTSLIDPNPRCDSWTDPVGGAALVQCTLASGHEGGHLFCVNLDDALLLPESSIPNEQSTAAPTDLCLVCGQPPEFGCKHDCTS